MQSNLYEYAESINCKHKLVSELNGYIYCKHPDAEGCYCIEDKGSKNQYFECPLGLPDIYETI